MLTEAGVIECAIDYDQKVPTDTLHEFIIEKLSQHPGDAIATVDSLTKSRWTFADILTGTKTLSAALQNDYGLLKGQVVALALPNCAEFIVSFLAISRCGGVSTLVNPSYTILELENVIKIARPTLWICSPEVLIQLDKIRSDEEPHRAIVVDFAQSVAKPIDSYDSQLRPWASVISSAQPEEFNELSFDVEQDLVALPFSSGTTGMPKGVMITHQNLVTSFYSFNDGWCPMNENDVSIGLLPIYHQMGCFLALVSLMVGAKIINVRKFSFTGMLQAIQEHKISVMALVPPIAVMLSKLNLVDDYDLRSVKVVLCAAAPLSPEVVEKLIHKFGWELMQGFGMTESLCTHVTPRGEKRLEKPGSVGILMPFSEAKIVDQDNSELALEGCGKIGELCLRGPMVMKGYKGNPTATAEAIDSSGWLHTGDLAYYDEEGWFFIVGRLKELIKFKGNQVAPSELEHIILQHPEVVDAAVVGIPDEMAGELPKAYVVIRAGSSVTEEEVANFLHGQVSSFKHLRGGLVFIPNIPKSNAGKILRKQLVSMP